MKEQSNVKKIEIYDPAMCCSTGVCGPSIDSELIRIAVQVESMQKQGIDVKRYNLSNEPEAFVKNEEIKARLEQEGPDVLPIICIDGVIRKEKAYPTTVEWSEWTGIMFQEHRSEDKEQTAACCGDENKDSSCCGSDSEDKDMTGAFCSFTPPDKNKNASGCCSDSNSSRSSCC